MTSDLCDGHNASPPEISKHFRPAVDPGMSTLEARTASAAVLVEHREMGRQSTCA